MNTLNGFKDDPDSEDELPTNKQLTKHAKKKLASFMYLQNTNQSKYGSILKKLNYQKSLRNEQYPKTILEVTEVLSNHQFDNASKMKHHKIRRGQKNDKDEDKNDNMPALAFMMEGRCYCF